MGDLHDGQLVYNLAPSSACACLIYLFVHCLSRSVGARRAVSCFALLPVLTWFSTGPCRTGAGAGAAVCLLSAVLAVVDRLCFRTWW
jgi:hypothetical protein